MMPKESNKFREFPLKLFKWFCNPDIHLDIEGDLIELYKRRIQQDGAKKAKLKLYKDVLLLFRPGIIRPISFLQINRLTIMIKYHLSLAIRGFMRYKTSFLINILGLSSALVCALFIYLWVMDEWKINRFHANDEQLYHVIQNLSSDKGIRTSLNSPALLANAVKKDIPEVAYATTINYSGARSRGILSYEENEFEARGLFASKDFFHVFPYSLYAGTPDKALAAPNSIVITKDLAFDLFGTLDDVVGKSLRSTRHLFETDYLITGIVENPPTYSTQQFDFVINYEMVFKNVPWVNEWGSDDARTYLVVEEKSKISQVEDKLNQLIAGKPDREGSELFLQQFSNTYLWGKYENGEIVGGRIAYVRLFSIIGILILLVAAINFINLATAQASRKMKQIGIQKAVGVDRANLRMQYLSESVLLCFFSFCIAIFISANLLPQVNELSGKQMNFQLGWLEWSTIALFIIGLGIVAGSYPAIYLSNLPTLQSLKGKLANSFSELWIRRGLVSLQFSVSIIFIIGFIILNRQINYLNQVDLGYDRDNVINFSLSGKYNRQTFLAELEQIPGVLNASNLSGGNIVDMMGSGSGFSWRGVASDEEITFNRPHIGYNFFETMNIEILEGRSFSKEFQNETEKLIINEAAAEIIGDPNIVGKTIMDGDYPKQIIGIAKNFKIRSLHEALQPCIMRFWDKGSSYMVRLKAGSERESLAQIEELYKKFEADYSFNYRFLDEDFQALYLAENRVASLSKYFSILAIIISALGLFGLVAFSLARRAKEISIRKVLGSSTFELIRLFVGEFSRTIALAIVISIPLAYWIIQKWLSNFAYKIQMEWWLFVLPALLIVLLFSTIIGLQTVSAANVNPVNNLKDD